MGLEQLEDRIKSVFIKAKVQTFDNVLNSYRHYLSRQEEVAVIFFLPTIKPFDGFKYSNLVMQSASSVNIIYTTQTDNEEIQELIRLNGGNRHITKPVTTEKIHALAMQEQEMCLEELDGNVAEECIGCIYHWCNNRNQNEERMT